MSDVLNTGQDIGETALPPDTPPPKTSVGSLLCDYLDGKIDDAQLEQHCLTHFGDKGSAKAQSVKDMAYINRSKKSNEIVKKLLNKGITPEQAKLELETHDQTGKTLEICMDLLAKSVARRFVQAEIQPDQVDDYCNLLPNADKIKSMARKLVIEYRKSITEKEGARMAS